MQTETLYTVIDTSYNEVIDETTNIDIAHRIVMDYEKDDCDNDNFIPDRYEIKESEREVDGYVSCISRVFSSLNNSI